MRKEVLISVLTFDKSAQYYSEELISFDELVLSVDCNCIVSNIILEMLAACVNEDWKSLSALVSSLDKALAQLLASKQE
jgi:predicted sugar kinase